MIWVSSKWKPLFCDFMEGKQYEEKKSNVHQLCGKGSTSQKSKWPPWPLSWANMSLDQNERVEGWRAGGVRGDKTGIGGRGGYISRDSGKEQESKIKRGWSASKMIASPAESHFKAGCVPLQSQQPPSRVSLWSLEKPGSLSLRPCSVCEQDPIVGHPGWNRIANL